MKSTNHSTHDQGFTLIELLLAMAFFGSVLLLATMLLMQVLNIYNKGMVVKQMNQVGRTLMEDMARVSNSGTSVMLTGNAGNISCITIGDVTYAWNRASGDPSDADGYAEDASQLYYYSGTNNPINFVKITNASVNCSDLVRNAKPAHASIDTASPVVGGTVRVYGATVNKLTGTDSLVRVAIMLGTFDTPGSEYNLYSNAANGNNLECRLTGLGNFCAKANFETVLYVPNREFN